MKLIRFNLYRFVFTLAVVSVLFGVGLYRLDIDTDIVDLLPRNDSAISDALYIFRNHPIQERLIIDVGLQKDDLDALVDYGELVEKRLQESGLFKTVGMKGVQDLIPELASLIVEDLPVMFTQKELEDKVKPLLDTKNIRNRLEEIYFKLHNLDGVGQAEFITKDPLGLKDVVMGRLAPLAPSQNAHIYRKSLVSSDQKHLLVIANQVSSGTDTRFSRKVVELIDEIAEELNQKSPGSGERVTLTPVGAYRAALDNELIVRRDVTKAILFATMGIALLLLFAFPRPYMGLLSLLPAIAGSMTAFFLFSLLHKSISIMVLGFGGAIISITVDHGIAYLLFLDRPHRTYGREASREVWSVGLVAALTTVGAFGALSLSGFPIFEQLGQFTALGISLSFIFVHTIFPLIFPVMSPSRARTLPLQGVVNKLALTGKKGAYMALVFALVMVFFSKPEFNVSLGSMNTLSTDTIAAEELVASVWGNIFNKIYLMTEGDSVKGLLRKGDRLLEMMDQELWSGTLSSGFVPSMIFPGEDRRESNLAAWRQFWNKGRIEALKRTMKRTSVKLGFTTDAFEPFYKMLFQSSHQTGANIPEEFLGLMGITRSHDGSAWVQISALTTGKTYNAERFYAKYSPLGKIFDPEFFSERLGKLLFSTFLRMLFIIGISVTFLLFLFFLDLRLTIISLLPVLFAFISTLGTLKLIGHPLDIPGLMLAIIVIGMGIDYSLFFVRSYQRYADASHSSFGLIRMAVFMASASTIIGFGVLCSAEHTLLRSAGLSSLFGIGYALIGAFVILPPLLKHLFQNQKADTRKDANPRDRVLRRYRNMEAYPRLFARFKMLLDPMFSELPILLESYQGIQTIIDVGCGYGVPACWFLERFPESKIYGIDPDPKRVRVASKAVGKRGSISHSGAPHIPKVPGLADAAIMLDSIHYLIDEEVGLTLERLYDSLCPGGKLIIRAPLAPERKFPWVWWLENIKLKISGTQCYYRSLDEIKTIIAQAGFEIELTAPSGSKGELVWLILKTRLLRS